MTKIIPAICAAILGLIFFTTNPAHIPAYVLLLIFALVGSVLVGAAYWVIYFLRGEKTQSRMPALILGLFLTLLVILKTIGQLTWRDGIALAILFIIINFYAKRLPRMFSAASNHQ